MDKVLIFHPPEGSGFRECSQCHHPYLWNEKWNSDICIWCEIHKDLPKE